MSMILRARTAAWSRCASANHWSATEIQRLREMSALGRSVDDIATALKRSASSIRNKAGMHGIAVRAKALASKKGD